MTETPSPGTPKVRHKLFLDLQVLQGCADDDGDVFLHLSLSGGPLKEPGMGVKFVDISDNDRDYIRVFNADHLTKDLASQEGKKRRSRGKSC